MGVVVLLFFPRALAPVRKSKDTQGNHNATPSIAITVHNFIYCFPSQMKLMSHHEHTLSFHNRKK